MAIPVTTIRSTSSRPIVRKGPTASPNILGTIKEGHPNWFPSTPGPVTTPARPPAPAGTPAGTPAGAPAGTPPAAPPAAPDLGNGKWLSYLTPDQLNAVTQAGAQYIQGTGDWTAAQDNARANYTQQSGQNQYEHDLNQRSTNEDLAARGLFDSSIRVNDLTDVNRTLAEKQAAAGAQLSALLGEATRAITALNTSWTGTQLAYQGIAAQNAASAVQAPAPAPAAPAPAPGTPAPGQPNILGQIAQGHPNWFPASGFGAPSPRAGERQAQGRTRRTENSDRRARGR